MLKLIFFVLMIFMNFFSSITFADDVQFFDDEYIVTINDKKGLCNKNGNCSYNPIYKDIIPKYSRYLIFQVSDNNYFLIDSKKDTKPAIRRAEYISEDWIYFQNF